MGNEAMKYVQGMESVGSCAFICRIISEGFMSPISGNFSNSKALAQWSLVYLATGKAFSCSYASVAFSSISSRLSLMLLQTSVGRADSRWSYFVDNWDMLQFLNWLSSLRNQLFGLCGQKSWILNAMWAACWSCSSFATFLYVHKVAWPGSRLQSRAGKSVCKGREYPLPLYVLRFIFKNVHGVLITCSKAWLRVKSKAGSPTVEEM